MSEQFQPPSEEVETLQDVSDAITLAFFDDEFEDCTVKDFPLIYDNHEPIYNPKIRRKQAFDVAMGCGVEVIQYVYDLLVDDVLEPHNCLVVDWDDGLETNLMFYVHSQVMATYLYEDEAFDDYMEFDEDELELPRIKLKMALAAVTTLLD